MAKKSKSQVSSKGKKKWYSIVAPANFDSKPLGDSLVYEPEDLVGKRIKVNLMNLTGEIKKQNMSIRFEVTDVKEGVGQTRATDFELSPGLIKRYVRKNRDRLDESLVYLTKDGQKIRIKPFVLTRNKVKGSQLTDLRKIMKIALSEIISSKDYESIYADIISYSIQKDIKDKMNKLVPIKNCEIRAFKLEKNTAKLSEVPKYVEKVADEEDAEEVEAPKAVEEKAAVEE